MSHQIHDPMEFIGLERENPLVVAERETGDGVSSHIRKRPTHLAVLDEEFPSLGIG